MGHSWRYNARPVQPGCGTDHSCLCLSRCHGGPGVLCGADQQSQEQAKETETARETTAADAAGSPTKDTFCVRVCLAKDDLLGLLAFQGDASLPVEVQ